MPKIISETSGVESPGVIAIDKFPVRMPESAKKEERPKETPKPSLPPVLESLSKITTRSVRRKPVYADTWTVGSPCDLDAIESYETDLASVTIGTADDGEIEYNVTPSEYAYPHQLDSLVEECVAHVRGCYRASGGNMDRIRAVSAAEEFFWKREQEISDLISDDCDISDAVSELSETVYRYTIGCGIFDILLSDQRLEDIYVDAPCDRNRIHVTLNSVGGDNSHVRCRTNLIADPKEMKNLISMLMKDSGLPFCESNPVLETDMYGGEARATVVGYPMSPNGDSLAIRKHSRVPWTLTRLIGNGTIDEHTAGLLSFLVANRSTMLIAGARGAGKSSLLSALLFELAIDQRILTIEDTLELPGDKMRSMGYKVQSMLIDERLGADAEKRADEALKVSLRLGESAIVLGEVRGEEAKTLYQSMRTGRAGSSVLGTIHGDSARTVYGRVVNDLQIPKESFMATDFIATMGTVRDRCSGKQIRRMNELVATSKRVGYFTDITKDEGLMKCPAMKRIMDSSSMSQEEILNEIDIRSSLRGFLAEMALTKGEGFYGPEWIVLANDHMTKNFSAGVTDKEAILGSFRERFKDFSGGKA